MSARKFQRLFWLERTITDFEPITLKEIQEKWETCPYNYDCKPYATRTFHDHIDDIFDLLDVRIRCNNRNEYYIDKEDKHSLSTNLQRKKIYAKNSQTIPEDLKIRQKRMNERFAWSEKNVRKLLKLNDTLSKLMDKAQERNDEVVQDLKSLYKSGKKSYTYWNVETHVDYDFYVEDDDALGVELADYFYEKLKTVWSTRLDLDKDPLNEKNWNIDELAQPSFNGHRICYLMYVIFSECCIPFQYGLLLDPNRFIVQTDVHV